MMQELQLKNIELIFNKEKPQTRGTEINIKSQINNPKDDIEYKFIIGLNGIWTTIQDYSEKDNCCWKPVYEGEYTVMVQARNKEGIKSFDYVAKEDYLISNKDLVSLIDEVKIDKTSLNVGEKCSIEVKACEEELLYRFYVKGEQGWELIIDYTADNTLLYTANNAGKKEFLIECKRVNSDDNFDDYTTVKIRVDDIEDVEITNFTCHNTEFIVGQELKFTLETKNEDNRTILYKFYKISKDGKATCVQDYSTKNYVAYKEYTQGSYRLLACAKDIFSNKEYDDRAVLLYNIKPYKDILIKGFTADLSSPQIIETDIKFKAEVEGGINLLYRYKVKGSYEEDTGFIRNSEYVWKPRESGKYVISVFVKDASSQCEYEACEEIEFEIEKKGNKPVKIVDVVIDKEKSVLINQPVNIMVNSEGGTRLNYSFIIYRNKVKIEKIENSNRNWVNFTPEEKGDYEIEIIVKDRYSDKEFDAHTFVYLKANEYIPGEIDYIMLPLKNNYVVGDTIEFESIIQNTKSVLVKYVTKINGHLVEETEFIKNKKLRFIPKTSGKYTIEVYAKNIKCTDEYDSKKEVSIYINEASPVINTEIIINKKKVKINNELSFEVKSTGGKDVCYEFYLMEHGNWNKVQSYSKKNYYSFMPFIKGKYKILVLSKSYYKNVNYEDYAEISFKVLD
ncbi:triple tyrosine motif-containing protein [Clostridium botulinum]|uniref:triple tyrosine motif-containing protein n=1 Tax=Clostridium botulinum TaxID=1491 RepID=UPI00144D4FF8|nr:triple tyrosine motif-containing protein [Clostridium botulinum]NFO05461.1 triple tyrosine motif-containing protein [Clostridium botulinum]UZP03796.1 triple tyrosine motif-containing protein [Clostridium botulinum]UZP07152.1 triple tyrosine motif-containing protein [Clostridium botulinum]UZP10534.1 triple tyrosine motif-containing protein [Clostridium botulinum]